MEEGTKICNDKECKHKGIPQPLVMFGNKDGVIGANNKCKKCVNRRQKAQYDKTHVPRVSKIMKQENPGWETAPGEDKLLTLVKPLYSFIINAPVIEGVICFGKSLGEIIMFFDVPQRAAMETLLHFIGRDEHGYFWKTQPKGVDHFTDVLKTLIPNGVAKKQPHNSVVYEQLEIFSERLITLENKLDLIINSLLGNKDED